MILYSINREIIHQGMLVPNWHFTLNNLCVMVGFEMKNLKLRVSLREIQIIDYHRDEEVQGVVPQALD